MASLGTGLPALLDWVARALLESGVLVVLALLVERTLLRGRAAALRAGLWACVFARLVIPPLLPEAAPGAQLSSALAAPGRTWVEAWVSPAAADLGSAFAVWVAVACVLLARLGFRARAARRELLQGSTPAQADTLHAAHAVARAVGLRRMPDVRQHPGSAPALVLGWRRPVILVAQRLEGPAREAALWHECMHLRRRDPLLQAAIEVLHALWWFHPLLPLAKRRAAAARELACDAAVVRAWRGGAETYRRVLLVEAARRLTSAHPAAVLAWVRGPANLRLRLEALDPGAGPAPRWTARAVLGLLALTSCITAASPALTRPPLPAWWSDVGAARAEVDLWRERRPGDGCTPGRLVLLRALALEQGHGSSPDS